MHVHNSFGRAARLRRLYRHGDDRLLIVPMDHSVTDGSMGGGTRLRRTVSDLARAGVDGVILHKGALRHVDAESFADMSLIVHLNASTVHAPDPDAKFMVTSVEEALRWGADAVSVHINVGSTQEERQIGDLARISDACEQWNVPLLAMMYPRGPRITDSSDPELVAHVITLAVDLGVDIVKTVPVQPDALRSITSRCPVPILVAGGARQDTLDATLAHVEAALSGGAAGVAMGRNIFDNPEPATVARAVGALVHRRPMTDAVDLRSATDQLGDDMSTHPDLNLNGRESVLSASRREN